MIPSAAPPVTPTALRAPTLGSHSDTAAIRRAARDFEAQALGAMLQPMFEGLSTKDSAFGGGAAEEQWRPMLVDAMARQAAGSGHGIGIADAMLRQLLQTQANAAFNQPTDAGETP
jgi:flagellar protein FlgJ